MSEIFQVLLQGRKTLFSLRASNFSEFPTQGKELGVKLTMEIRDTSDDGVFEVNSDLLYFRGRTLHRGDQLTQTEIGPVVIILVQLGMIKKTSSYRRAA